MAEKQKLAQLASRSYKDQAVWFLNAFWEKLHPAGEAEKLWNFVNKAAELDEAKRAEGNELDEFQAHRFLEFFKETMTVQAMRDKLRSLGAIEMGVVKKVPLIHILIFKYGVDWKELVNAPQGNKEDIEKAQKLLDEVTVAFQASEARDREAAEAVRAATQQEAEAKAAEQDAISKEQEAHAREDELRAAKQELEAALAELKAQEDAFNSRTAELQRLSEEGSIVQKNKAKNELAQHLSSDPLPLRKAKITQEAAVKKADRAAQAAREATERATEARSAAQAARREAEAGRQRAEEAKAAAEAAVEEARQRLAAAEAYLEEVKNTLPLGGSWWMERELHERRAYLPSSKGGYNKRTLGQ